MKTVFVKEGSSKSYTNLITSSAALPLKKKKLSREPIGQQQPPLGINNVETQTTHRRAKLQLQRAVGLFHRANLDGFIPEKHSERREKVRLNILRSFSIIPGGPPNISAAVRFIVALPERLWYI